MKNKDFLTFMVERETPPASLKKDAQKDILLSFHARSILLRFLAFQLLGALFSMAFCPQFGLGLVSGHGVTHIFRMIGDWACAVFCGSLFLSSGMFVAFIGMKGEELWWVWRRYKFSLIFLPALMWLGLMFTNIDFRLTSEAPSYHLYWIASAILAQAAFLQVRSYLYSKA
jgi:hypothetical protein